MEVREFIYILPNYSGGVATVVSNLIRYSTHPEISKKVILTGCKMKTACKVDFGDAKVIVETIENEWTTSKRLYAKRIARHISPYSIIICNDGNPEYAMVEMLKLNNPVISLLHGDNCHYFNGGRRYGYLIDRMICVSSYLMDKAKINFTANTDPVFIPFPIPKIQNKRKHTLNSLIISYAGSITYMKGCEFFPLLIEALEFEGIDYKFNIFGEGELLPELIEETQGNTHVIFHGQKPNNIILEMLQQTDISILFSKSEGLPVCIVEAMKCGCVPVVFDLSTGIPDLIDDGINGFRLKQGDIHGCIERILQLYHDRELLLSMSHMAMKKSSSLFDPYKQTEAYESIFLNTYSNSNKFNNRTISKTSFFNAIPLAIASPLKELKKRILH